MKKTMIAAFTVVLSAARLDAPVRARVCVNVANGREIPAHKRMEGGRRICG